MFSKGSPMKQNKGVVNTSHLYSPAPLLFKLSQDILPLPSFEQGTGWLLEKEVSDTCSAKFQNLLLLPSVILPTASLLSYNPPNVILSPGAENQIQSLLSSYISFASTEHLIVERLEEVVQKTRQNATTYKKGTLKEIVSLCLQTNELRNYPIKYLSWLNLVLFQSMPNF